MADREWNGMEDAFSDGQRTAAQDLMDALRKAGVHDDDWNGGDVVTVVERWLRDNGVDTHVPDPDDNPAARAALDRMALTTGCTCCQVRAYPRPRRDAECPNCGHLKAVHAGRVD